MNKFASGLASLILLCLGVGVGVVHAQSEAQIRAELQKRIGPNTKIKSVNPSPISGVYEVQVGTEVIYTDSNSKY